MSLESSQFNKILCVSDNVSSLLGVLLYKYTKYLFLVRLKEHPGSWQPCSFLETSNEIPFYCSIISRFWSTMSQIIDDAVLNHIKKKLWFYYENSEINKKRSFRSRMHGKAPVWNKQILARCETRFPCVDNFQILQAGSNTIKEFWKFSDFKKIILIFWKKWGFLIFFQNTRLLGTNLILMNICLKWLY